MKVDIDLKKELVDDAVIKHIKSLESKLSRRDEKIKKLEKKLDEREKNDERVKEILADFRDFVEKHFDEVAWSFYSNYEL